MHSLTQLISNAGTLTLKNRFLWVLQAIPTLFVVATGYAAFMKTIAPLILSYQSFVEATEVDPRLFLAVVEEAKESLYILIPVLAVYGLLTLFFRTGIYYAIAERVQGHAVSWKNAIRAAGRYMWIVLGLLLTLTALEIGISVISLLLTIAGVSSVVVTVLELLLLALLAMAALFAWPALLIRKEGIAPALRTSFVCTYRSIWPITVIGAILLLVSLVQICFFGIAVDVGYLISVQSGVVVACVLAILFIPVRVYAHALYVMLFMAIQPDSTRRTN